QGRNQPRQSRLSASRLANQAQGLAPPDLQVDSVHGAHSEPTEPADREVLVCALDVDQHRVGRRDPGGRPLSRLHRPPPPPSTPSASPRLPWRARSSSPPRRLPL